MWSNLLAVTLLFLLFALSIVNIVYGLVRERFRTPKGKQLVSIGLIVFAASVVFSIYNGFVRSSLLVNVIGLLILVSGFVIAGVAWYQTTPG